METIEIYINKINDQEWKGLKEKLISFIIGTKINKSARVLVFSMPILDLLILKLQILIVLISTTPQWWMQILISIISNVKKGGNI